MPTLDVRDIEPADRHPKIHSAFEELRPGDTLTIINDHEPKPLYYEMAAERPAFDEENYEVSREAPQKFVAAFPKAEADATVTRTSLAELGDTPTAVAFPGETPKTVRLDLDAGETVPSHIHPEKEIVMYLVSGELDLTLDGETHHAAADDLLRFDGDQQIELTATDATTALLVLAPRARAD
jgi:uncharacterized protein (DUF2249 family)